MIKKIYYYDLKIYKKPLKYSFEEDLFVCDQKDILAQNERYVVLNNQFFTKLEIKGKDSGSIYNIINKPSIRFKDCLSQKGIFYTLYSTKKTRISTIKSQIKTKAIERYGYLFSDELDLSILTEEKS